MQNEFELFNIRELSQLATDAGKRIVIHCPLLIRLGSSIVLIFVERLEWIRNCWAIPQNSRNCFPFMPPNHHVVNCDQGLRECTSTMLQSFSCRNDQSLETPLENFFSRSPPKALMNCASVARICLKGERGRFSSDLTNINIMAGNLTSSAGIDDRLRRISLKKPKIGV